MNTNIDALASMKNLILYLLALMENLEAMALIKILTVGSLNSALSKSPYFTNFGVGGKISILKILNVFLRLKFCLRLELEEI